MIVAICLSFGWMAGCAFWFGWNKGALQEMQIPSVNTPFPGSIWVMWPLYKLGHTLGQRYMARELAPERMRQKLLQEQPPSGPYYPGMITGITTTPNTSPSWYGAGSSSGTP